MCPECFANAALMVSGIVSTGGVSVLAVTMLRGKKSPNMEKTESEQRRNHDGNNDNQQIRGQDRKP